MGISCHLATIAVVATITLTACQPTAAPSPQIPSPSPTAAALEVAVPVFDIACDAAAPAGTLAGFLGSEPGLNWDGSGDPQSLDQAAHQQAGALTCQWNYSVDAGPYIGFTALPNAASEFGVWVGEATLVPNAYQHVDEFGDRSLHSCGYGYCAADVLVDDVWINVSGADYAAMDELDIEPQFIAVVDAVVASIERASDERRPSWTLPAGVLGGDGGLELPGDELGAAVGLSGGYCGGGGDWGGVLALAYYRTSPVSCSVVSDVDQQVPGVYVEILPGGAWTVQEWMSRPPAHQYGGDYALVEDAELGPVFIVQTGWPSAAALFALDGSLVRVERDGASADLLPLLPAIVATLTAQS